MRFMLSTYTPPAPYGNGRPAGLNPLYFALIVKHEAAAITGLPLSSIDEDDSLRTLGMDSLDVAELADKLEKGLSLPGSLAGRFDSDSTVSQVAEACRLECKKHIKP